MLDVCIFAAGRIIALGSLFFTLGWTHTVERTAWQEEWRLTDTGFRLVEARVKGSGAGMDPGAGARLENGWYVWQPAAMIVERLVLANSGADFPGWTICANGKCQKLTAVQGSPTIIGACPGQISPMENQ